MPFILLLNYIKPFFHIIISFFNTKIGKITLVLALVCLSHYYTYNKGFNAGEEAQIAFYKDKLEEALNKQEKRLEIEKNEAIKLIEKEKETEIKYIESKKIIKEIVKNNKDINNYKLPRSEAIKFNNALDNIK